MDALIVAAAAEAEPQGDEMKAADIVERKRQELQAAETKLATENETRTRRETTLNRLAELRRELVEAPDPEALEASREGLLARAAQEVRNMSSHGMHNEYARPSSNALTQQIIALPVTVELWRRVRAEIEQEIRGLKSALSD